MPNGREAIGDERLYQGQIVLMSTPPFKPSAIAVACLILALAGRPVRADISLSRFFGNGMVLQRDGRAPIWGMATPHEEIDGELNGQTVSCVADDHGAWSIAFNGLHAGGPFKLTLKGASQTVTLSDVLVGDVWLCSGQSNMVFMVSDMGALAKDDVAAANDPQLRWFVPKTYFVDDQYKGRAWTATTPSTITGDSSVAFYFARELRKQLNVPIGVLEVAFPGSPIEGWFSPQGIDTAGLSAESKALTDEYANLDKATPRFLSDLGGWEARYGRADPGNKGFSQGFADPKFSVTDWKTIPSLGDWSSLDMKHGGAFWVRKTVDIPNDLVGTDLNLVVGYLRNEGKEFGNILGTVYFNNQEVGTIGSVLKHIYTSPDETSFTIPGKLLHAGGDNLIAVRFFSQEQAAPWKKHDFVLKTLEKKKPVPIVTQECLAKVESPLPELPADALSTRPMPPPSPPQVRLPSLFYNLMLKPVIGYGIKGVIWYQGEANTESFGGAVPSILGNNPAESYRKLLPALIADWRTLWKQEDLPFYIVQLPNTNTHNKLTGQPEKSDWAALRESQLMSWKSTANTGMVVTIDTGNGDLHPTNKKPVGERMAAVALANVYGRKIDASGPIYDSMVIEGNKIRLKFRYAAGGLVAKSTPIKEVAIAGANRKFVWADATIDGETLVVSNPDVASPEAVRYGWADNPISCGLFNSAGLPASPFRTDDWPLR